MKEKYTIRIADYEMTLQSDASKAEVDTIAQTLDRRIRDIIAHSANCTRNEALVLCAMSYCSEQMSFHDAYTKNQEDYTRVVNENEKLRAELENLKKELSASRRDSDILRNMLDRLEKVNASPKTEYQPKPFGALLDEEPVTIKPEVPVAPVVSAPVEPEKPKKAPKKPLGNLDMLFGDM